MKSPVAPIRVDRVLVTLLAAVLAAAPRSNAAESSASADKPANGESEAVLLSPFQVDASKDKGYRATNSISGSRLNMEIKNIPMPIEVITEEFIKDTGSKDLRGSLRYSAGILLNSQNDAGQGNTFVNAGGVHATEGATAAASSPTRRCATDSAGSTRATPPTSGASRWCAARRRCSTASAISAAS
jgi:outer membrane receptor for monomeric catechols